MQNKSRLYQVPTGCITFLLASARYLTHPAVKRETITLHSRKQ
uniref:Uncharacterized protein n=1 Tax=Anguilla anguilla TaxID=7936 RepID=A0A0E9SSJ8_ANGAN